MKPITIIFVDDHPLIRKAWAFILKHDPRFKLIASCESGEEAIEKCSQLCPDVVIMDIRLRGISGIEATKLIRKNCPGTKIIGLSFHSQPHDAQEIIENGAMGYLTKLSNPEEIFKAILEVQQGRSYVCQEMEGRLVIAPF
ncbi:MAG TPA: response regulator transcription factor [Puia sp.]|jgi:DNA-binding NarL/FixJ family response regulator|nr:response regulator transcription factor [Puia sp.]